VRLLHRSLYLFIHSLIEAYFSSSFFKESRKAVTAVEAQIHKTAAPRLRVIQRNLPVSPPQPTEGTPVPLRVEKMLMSVSFAEG